MKLHLNKSLRAALLSCYALTASIATTLPIATVATGLVTFSLLSEKAEAASQTITGGGQFSDLDVNLTGTEDYLITNFTSGYIGGQPAKWIAPKIYVQNWIQTGGSGNESLYAKGDLYDYKLLPSSVDPSAPATPVANIVYSASPGGSLSHDFIFDGNQSNFSGDFILNMGNANGRDFVFTYNTDYGDTVQTNVTGTGSITMNAGVEYDGNAHFYYSGSVTIGNKTISADALTLNAKTTGAHDSSSDYKTSHTTRDGTGGATYSISSQLSLNTLEINDGSTAILIGSVDSPAPSTVGTVSFAGTGANLQVGAHAHLTLTGVQTAGGDNLSILSEGQLTINGRLNLSSAIANAGTLAFGTGGLLDISSIAAESIVGGYAYQLFTEGSTGTLNLTNLTWESILGVNGLSASSTISYASGKLSITGVVATLGFTGSNDSSSPASLDWNAEGAFDGGASFGTGQSVNFSGHTSATITTSTQAGVITVADGSSLSIGVAEGAAEGVSFSAARVALEGSTQMRIGVASLDVSARALELAGGAGATFRLDGAGTGYNLADVLNLENYGGEVSMNNATINVTAATDFGNSLVLTLGEGATLSTNGVSLNRRLHVGGDAALTNTGSATVAMGTITGVAGNTLTINGIINMHNDVTFAGDIVIASGATTFGAAQSASHSLAAASVTIKAGARLIINHATGDFTGTNVILEGTDSTAAVLRGNDMGANVIADFNNLTLSGKTTISHAYNGIFRFTDLTGSGTLTVYQGNLGAAEVNKLEFNAVTNFNGSINAAEGTEIDQILFGGEISQDAGMHMVVSRSGGSSNIELHNSATFTGAGSVTFNSAVKIWNATLVDSTLNLSGYQFGSTGSQLVALGGYLNLNGASFDSAVDATLQLGATTVGSTEAAVTWADNIQLGAHEGTVGTAEAPIVTTINTTKNGSNGEAVAMTISGNISDASGTIGKLKVEGVGSLTLSGDNSFTSGLDITQSSIILGSATAAGTGTVNLSAGSLNVGGQAISNVVNYSGGALSGMSAFAGTLNVNSNLSLSDGISGNVNVAAATTLTLGGIWNYSSAINNFGTVVFGSDMILDITGISFVDNGNGVYELSLVDGGTLTDADWLMTGALDMAKLAGAVEGRDYSYANGVLSYKLSGKQLRWNGGVLQLSVGASFSEGGGFANNDAITFEAFSDTPLQIMEAVSSSSVILEEAAIVTTFATAYELSVGELTLKENSSFTAGANVTASTINMELGSSLSITSLDGVNVVNLYDTAHLSLTGDLAAGAVAIDNVNGGVDSQMTVYLADAGTSVTAANFTGNLIVAKGAMKSTYADVTDFASVSLGAGTSYEVTDVRSESTSLISIKGNANSTLIISGVGIDSGAGDRTQIALSNDFSGTMEFKSGAIDVFYSDLGGASKLLLHNGTGLVGTGDAGVTSTLSTAVTIQSGASVFGRVWGSERVLDLQGAITGDATTTLRQTDLGTLKLSGDMSAFAGTLSVVGNKIVVDTDASNINRVVIGSEKTFEVAANRNVSVGANVEGANYYTNSVNHDFNIVVQAGATLTDNVYLRLSNSEFTLSGGGTYIIDGYMGGDLASGRASEVNIGAGTTLRSIGTKTATASNDEPSFMLGHWGSTSTFNVSGTLDIASLITNKDGSGTINVNDGGTLTLRKGLYGNDIGNNANTININIASGATLQLQNQETVSNDSAFVAKVYAGATIEAIVDATTEIKQRIRMNGDGNVALTAASDVNTVNVTGILAQDGDGSTGLAITGTDLGQTYNLNAANTYTGGTSIAGGAKVVAGNAAAFGTGAVTLSGGELDLNGQAVTNSVTVNGGRISGFSAYAGTVSIASAVTVSDTITGGINVLSGAELTLNGTWDYSSAITNAGTVTFGSDLTLSLDDSLFDASGQLTLFTGAGSADITAWLNGGLVDPTKLDGVLTAGRTYSYANGILSFVVNNKDLTWLGGDGTWNTSDTSTAWNDGTNNTFYTQGDAVTFGASSEMDNNIVLEGSIEAASVTVNSEQNYTFGGLGSLDGVMALTKDGTGTLTISTTNNYTGGTTLNAGTLRINSMAALGAGTLTINGGVLSLYETADMAVDANRINIGTAGALNINLDNIDATLSNAASLGAHALAVTGTGELDYDGWADTSSVHVGAGAAVHFSNAGAISANYKTISGAGNISTSSTSNFEFLMQLDAANLFTGKLQVNENAKAVLDVDASSAASRMGINVATGANLVIDSDAVATLYLDELSGSGTIRYDWRPFVVRNIDLEMSSNQTFSGSFLHDVERMGAVSVRSVEGARYSFILDGAGYTQNTSAKTLHVYNAAVALQDDAKWNGAINLHTENSLISFEGNAYTREAAAGGISGAGNVGISTTVTFNGANTYTGTTDIQDGGLTVGHVNALGASEVNVYNGASLDLGGHSVTNNVNVYNGSISGFSAYAGTVSIASAVTVSDTITGGINVLSGASLTLSGTWDYSSTINNEGSLTFGSTLQLVLQEGDFSELGGTYSLNLFTDGGTSDLTGWLTGGAVDISKISNMDTDGKTFSYANGVLSYTLISSGSIVIPDGTNRPISGANQPSITLGGGTAQADLGGGFTQEAGTAITGEGVVAITAGETATLSEANSYTGTTAVGEGSILNVANNQALGTSNVKADVGGNVIVELGIEMSNNVQLAEGARISAGVLTATGRAGVVSTLTGVDSLVSHDESGAGSIAGATLVSMDVQLAENGTGSINNSVLTDTLVQLGVGSTMTMIDTVQGAGSRIENTDATLRLVDHTLQASVAAGSLTIGATPQEITTQEGDNHMMNVYSLTSINVANVSIESSLTLDIILSDSEFDTFTSHLLTSGEFVAFELAGIAQDELAGLSYSNAFINVYDGSLTGAVTNLTASGASSLNGNAVLYIPEPSTATLSLLALAGLLARRRRKTEV